MSLVTSSIAPFPLTLRAALAAVRGERRGSRRVANRSALAPGAERSGAPPKREDRGQRAPPVGAAPQPPHNSGVDLERARHTRERRGEGLTASFSCRRAPALRPCGLLE